MKADKKLSVLMILPFEDIYPPVNGGMLRCFHLLHQLAKDFEVTALMHQGRASFEKCFIDFPALKNCNVLSTADYIHQEKFIGFFPAKFRPGIIHRIYKRSFRGPADGHFIRYYPLLEGLLKKGKIDFVVMENLSCLNAVPVIRRLSPKTRIILNAHNIDSDLAYNAFQKNILSKKDWQHILKTESSLYKRVDAVLTCSSMDLEKLQGLNKGKLTGVVIPNGVAMEKTAKRQASQPEILFCGSMDYGPNREGIVWFLEKCWPMILERNNQIILNVIGNGDPGELKKIFESTRNIAFHGKVPLTRPWYERSSLVIVPLLSGSGTRLKVVEAMGMGVPVVSTAKGAEGIEYTDEKNILIADKPEDFSNAVVNLINDPHWNSQMGQNGFQLAKENYDWDIIGKKLNKWMESFHSYDQYL